MQRIERITYPPAGAAELLGISRAQIYKLIKAGSLRVVRAGRRKTLIALRELERFASEGVNTR